MNKIDLKTIVGVGAGVAIGHFAFKSKNPLVLMAFGLGGGILSYHILKNKNDEISETQKKASNYVEQIEKDIDEKLDNNNSSSSITGDKIKFNKTIGYPTPQGDVIENDPAEFMDIGF